MAEYEELQLTVTLIDNATQGLQNLRQNLRDLGGSENREALQRMQQEVEKLSEKMTKVRDHMGLTAKAAESLGRSIGNSIRAFGTAFVSSFALNSLKTFTDEMVRLDATAKQFGVGGAELKSLVEQMGIMGIGAPQATQAVTGFANALAEIGRNGSQLRENIMRGAISDPDAMAKLLQRLTGLGSKGEIGKAMTEFIDAANNAYENELERTGGNKGKAAQRRNELLGMFQFDPATAAMIQGQFRDITDAEREEYARRTAIAQSYNQQWNKMALQYKEFVQGMQTTLLPTLEAINKAIGTMGDKWGEAFGTELTNSINKAIESITFLYRLINDPGATIKQSIKDQALQAHPTVQSMMRGMGLNVPTTEKNQKYWDEQRAQGNFTIWDSTTGVGTDQKPGFPADRFGDWPTPPASKMSYRGGDSAMPQAIKASLGGAPIRVPGGNPDYSRSNSGAMAEFSRAVRTGTFEALVDFRTFMQGGGAGGGGAQNASLTTGPDSTSANPSSRSGPDSTGPSTGPGTGPGAGPSASPSAPDIVNPFGGGRTSVGPTGGGGPSGFNPFGGVRTGVGKLNPFGGERGSVSGGATPAGDAPASGDAAGGDVAGEAAFLAEKRAGFKKELDENPATRELLGGIISAENPGAGPAVAESLMNRTELVNQDRAKRGLPPLTLHDMIVGKDGKSFYGPMRTGAINQHLARMRSDPKYAAAMNARIDQALGGSNTIQSNTDQGSAGDPNYVAGGVGVNINRERFNDWGYRGSREWRLQRQRDIAAARDRQNSGASNTSVGKGDRDLFDSDMGNEITMHSVEGSGKVTVDVGGTKQPAGKNRARLFSKIETPRARQMEPAESGPPVKHESGGGDEAAWL
jgi:hypothetical protein